MWNWLEKRKQRGQWRRAPARLNRLTAVPVTNDAVTAEARGESMVLWVPVAKRWFNKPPFSWALPYRERRGVGLDKLGREVFEMIDGERTIEEMIDQFAEHHKLRFHEARQSVLAFLRMLVERNLVVLAIPGGEGLQQRGSEVDDAES